MNPSRRTFVIACIGAVSSLGLQGRTFAAGSSPKLEESDPQAKQYSYRHDASKVDAGRNPNYKVGLTCANCSLFSGQSGEDWGGCLIFGDKQVAAKGWCNQYTNT